MEARHLVLGVALLIAAGTCAATYSVTSFGADGSDSDPDRKAIQDALDKAKGVSDVTVVTVPAGTYYLDRALFFYPNTRLSLAKGAKFLATSRTDWKRATCVFAAFAVARAVSATVNYICNRKLVFKSKVSKRKSFLKYWVLVLAIMAAGYGLTAGLSRALDAKDLAITAIKIAVETALFFCSYGIQKRWIFRS